MGPLGRLTVVGPIVNAIGWEIVHRFADGAVILAVIVGLYELWSHRGERRDLAAAIDDHIRVLAIQAWMQVRAERVRGALGALSRLINRGNLPGDLMATWLTAIAAEAPRASSQVRRDARDVAKMFFALAVAAKQDQLSHGTPDPVTASLGDDLIRFEERLALLGGVAT